MNIRKLSLRTGLGVLAISLIVSSAFGLFIASESNSSQTITNVAGLTGNCTSTFVSPTGNNGTSGGHEAFFYSYTCTTATATPDALTSVGQGVFSVTTAASYKPIFAVATTGGATVTSTTLVVQYGSIQTAAQWCVLSDSRNAGLTLTLTSGTFVSLPASLTCFNGTSSNPTNVIWYDITIVVSTFGSVSVPAFTITWNSS
jgi:hypothetical protein